MGGLEISTTDALNASLDSIIKLSSSSPSANSQTQQPSAAKERLEEIQKLRHERKEAAEPLNRTSSNLLQALDQAVVEHQLEKRAKKRYEQKPSSTIKRSCTLLNETNHANPAFVYAAGSFARQVVQGEFRLDRNKTMKTNNSVDGKRSAKAKKLKFRMKGQSYSDKLERRLSKSKNKNKKSNRRRKN